MKTLHLYRVRFWARFPRLSYWAGLHRVRVWMAWLYAAVMCGNVADGAIGRAWMWLPAAVIALLAGLALADSAVHAAACPCVFGIDPAAGYEPEDEVPGDD